MPRYPCGSRGRHAGQHPAPSARAPPPNRRPRPRPHPRMPVVATTLVRFSALAAKGRRTGSGQKVLRQIHVKAPRWAQTTASPCMRARGSIARQRDCELFYQEELCRLPPQTRAKFSLREAADMVPKGAKDPEYRGLAARLRPDAHFLRTRPCAAPGRHLRGRVSRSRRTLSSAPCA